MSTTVEIPLQDLPLWMRRARQGINWGIPLVLAFGLLAGWLFWLYPGLPMTGANENHAFMTADFTRLLREGVLYPRWSAHAINGYGAPIPNFLPTGAPLLAALIDMLFTNDTVNAIRLVYGLSLAVSGVCMYLFAQAWTNPIGAVLAYLLYLFNPYIAFTIPHVLGDLPGALAAALLPALLYFGGQLVLYQRPIDGFVTSFITAMLIFTFPQMALAGMLLLLLLGMTQRNSIVGVILAMAGGVMLAAFFWLPALFEREGIRWDMPTGSGYTHTLRLRTVFAAFDQLDIAALKPPVQFTLGWISGLFALLGTLGAVMRRQTVPSLFAATGVIVLATALLAAPSQTWILSVCAFCFAVAGSGVPLLAERFLGQRARMLVPALMVTVLMAMPGIWLSPFWLNATPNVSGDAQIRYEQQGWGVAVLPPGTAVPTTLPFGVRPNRVLVGSYGTGTIDRISHNPDMRTAQVNLLNSSAQSMSFQVISERELRLQLLLTYFAGWKATLNGETIPLYRDLDTGLMWIEVPASRNGIVDITLSSTPIRTTAWVMSWLTLVILLVLGWFWNRRTLQPAFRETKWLEVAEARLVLLVLVCFGGVVFATATPTAIYPLRTPPGLTGTKAVQANTEVGLQLLSYQVAGSVLHPGQTLDLTLYWRALRFLPANYLITVTLQDINRGIDWVIATNRHPGGYPTRRWTTRGYVADPYVTTLPNEILTGTYRILIEAAPCLQTCDEHLTFFSNPGEPGTDGLALPQLLTITQ